MLIVPSLWEENSPLVIHEASSAKLPVIASRIGGLPEIVSPAHGGILFEPGSSLELGEIINKLAKYPRQIKKMQSKIRMIRNIEKDVEILLSDYRILTEHRLGSESQIGKSRRSS